MQPFGPNPLIRRAKMSRIILSSLHDISLFLPLARATIPYDTPKMVAFFWRCNHQTWESSGESYGDSGDNPSEGARQRFYGVSLPTKKGDGAPNMGGVNGYKRIKIGVSTMRAESQVFLVTCQTSGFCFNKTKSQWPETGM